MAEKIAAQRLWHGGAPGRRPGDWLLPPIETGFASTVRQMSIEAGMTEISQRGDRVTSPQIGTSHGLGRAYGPPDGVHHGGGSLYRVEADELEADDDLLSPPGVSFQSETARVLVVYDAHVAYHPKFGRLLQKVLADHAAAKSAREDGTELL